MNIGEKIRRLRTRRGLTQEELANRCELTKGFISQVENDVTSPSISTLCDILDSLGTDLRGFFSEREEARIVFGSEDVAVLEDDGAGARIEWLVPNAQKNDMEPLLVTLPPGAATVLDDPHEGEEFGYVLSGAVWVLLGDRKLKAQKGESFYYDTDAPHGLKNAGKAKAIVLWVSSPPSF